MRTQMVVNLQIPASDESVKHLDSPPETLSASGLASCVTQRTVALFDVLALNRKMKAKDFLAKDRAEWDDDLSYQELKNSSINNEGRERYGRESHSIDAAVQFISDQERGAAVVSPTSA